MKKARILIVEDELLVAEDIRNLLQSLDYTVTGIATTYKDAVRMLSFRDPDLALIDIKIKGDKDGIMLAGWIRQRYNIAIVFLTSHANEETIERAKKFNPEGYLMKPFRKKELYAAIEVALSHFASHHTVPEDEAHKAGETIVSRNEIFIKAENTYIKIHQSDILWIQAFGNYLVLHCTGEKHTVRSTFREMLEKLPGEQFLKVHRSHAVNLEQIRIIRQNALVIGDHHIPIGRTYLEKVKKVLDLNR